MIKPRSNNANAPRPNSTLTKNNHSNSNMKNNAPSSLVSLAARCGLSLLAALALIPAVRAADAYPPDRMTYQGYVVDATGAALGLSAPKNYDAVFRIYDAMTSGNRLWTEQQTITVDKGYFSVMLGEGTQVSSEAHGALSSLFASATASDRFVEITVKGVAGTGDLTITPRLRLLPTPYAFLAKSANTAASAASIVNTNGAQIISIVGTNVSIGATNPGSLLTVGGNLQVSSLSVGTTNMANRNGSSSWIAACFGNSSYSSGASVVIGDIFGYAVIGAHSAALDTWQDLYVGTTPGSDGAVGCPSTVSLPYVHIGNRAAGVGAGAEQGGHLLKLSGGAYCDGNGAWVSGSDRAYKKDIKDMTQYGLAQVLALRPVTYVHKQDTEGKTQIGFIAQEVKPIVPDVVEGPEGSMGLAYDRLVPVLVNAIKEQQAQIEQLKAAVEILQKASGK